MKRILELLLVALILTSCGGGGGGGTTLVFALSGSVPVDGTLDVPVDAPIVVTFNQNADLGTITAANVELEGSDGVPVAFEIRLQNFNPNNIRLIPQFALTPNVIYEVTLKGAIRSEAGDALGADSKICFLTKNPVPTVRPDQVIDLGDQLNIPRYLARAIRLMDGRWAVIGGFTDPTTATDTIEVWDPANRTFELLPIRMNVARAEHTLTMLSDGRVVIIGGVSEPGGEPLASTEFFDPSNNGLAFGPSLLQARRWHGASPFESASTVMVTGGFATSSDDSGLDDGEVLRGNSWEAVPGMLAGPTAQHVQALNGFDAVYIGVGNIFGEAGTFDGVELRPRLEGDGRRRSRFLPVPGNRIVIVGGDTRSSIIYDFGANFAWGGNTFLRQRRGAHSLTYRDGNQRLFLAAGGFQISAQGIPALATLEVVEYLPNGPFGLPDVIVYPVIGVELPVPVAGHVGFNEPSGATVLAGGVGDGVGPHSRRVVMILDVSTTPPLSCD